jgi:hypothetical protein
MFVLQTEREATLLHGVLNYVITSGFYKEKPDTENELIELRRRLYKHAMPMEETGEL